jgi:cell division protein FtsX
MEKILDMVNQKVQDALKKFQDITNKKLEDAQKQLKELKKNFYKY